MTWERIQQSSQGTRMEGGNIEEDKKEEEEGNKVGEEKEKMFSWKITSSERKVV